MLAHIIAWLNYLANATLGLLFVPIAWMPGWLSATLIGIVTGVLMLVVFKYTSPQKAIKRTRNQIKSNMLALSIFKDDLRVSLRCQGRLLMGAFQLVLYSLIPIAVMTVPMVLILGQMSLWYQARPLKVGEASIVAVNLRENQTDLVDQIELSPSRETKVVSGPVRVPSKNMVCWEVAPATAGKHELVFSVSDQTFSKELAAGESFLPVSIKRPSFAWSDLVLHPRETPFNDDSAVQSIEVTYPARESWTSGTDNWLIYWFVVSMIAAFAVKPILKVNI